MCSKTSVSCLATSNCRQRVQSECTLMIRVKNVQNKEINNPLLVGQNSKIQI